MSQTDRSDAVRPSPAHAHGATVRRAPLRVAPTLHRGRGAPPSQGAPLALRLGITISLVVVLTLGAITLEQQRREITGDRQALEALLAESLRPVRLELAAATSVAQLRDRIAELDRAYAGSGRRDHWIVLKDETGAIVAASPASADSAPARPASLIATVSVTSPALPSGRGTLTLARDASRFATDVAVRLRLWLLDLALTAVCIVATLLVAMHFLLTRPLRRLVEQLSRTEAGYVGEITLRGGAKELRWLAWHSQKLVAELSESARRLVWAERRAHDPAPDTLAVGPLPAAANGGEGDEPGIARALLRRYLRDRCRLLESLDASDPAARMIAQAAWFEDTVAAARAGEMGLRGRLDNAAMRILEPETYAKVEHEVSSLVASRNGWTERIAGELAEALQSGGTPFVEIQHRVKHVAGVWRKMQARKLTAAEVQDLFAFRVIVPDEAHCYHALRAVHERFEPEPFRFKDYIARPKGNGYRGLHTCVRDGCEAVFEVQIRSLEMHTSAERGASAHWRYVAGKASDGSHSPAGLWRLRPRLGRLARPSGPPSTPAGGPRADV
jgi:hypothetical protein